MATQVGAYLFSRKLLGSMYVDVLKRDAFFETFHLFFDNIAEMKSYLCVHYCHYWQNKSFFKTYYTFLFGCLPNFYNPISISTNYSYSRGL